ncbi:hypothetical protein ACFODL_15465 [Phenylobacterium terrae]|uniref:Uncharacterized protein n=1 Tax=Phenylobacterium terrae TaxID=2665495 RepID=A0ABW4N6Z5_9CAUL
MTVSLIDRLFSIFRREPKVEPNLSDLSDRLVVRACNYGYQPSGYSEFALNWLERHDEQIIVAWARANRLRVRRQNWWDIGKSGLYLMSGSHPNGRLVLGPSQSHAAVEFTLRCGGDQ